MNHIPSASRQLGAGGWRKPWSGHNGGSCVEIKPLADGRFALRQSADPDGPALVFTEAELDVFAAGWTPHKDGLRAPDPPPAGPLQRYCRPPSAAHTTRRTPAHRPGH